MTHDFRTSVSYAFRTADSAEMDGPKQARVCVSPLKETALTTTLTQWHRRQQRLNWIQLAPHTSSNCSTTTQHRVHLKNHTY